MKRFSVSVTAVPDSGPSSADIGGISVAVVLLVAAAAAGIYCHHRSKQTGNGTPRDDPPQEDGVAELASLNQTETPQMDDDNETETDNGTSPSET
ncbi:hypothetical protein R3I94_017855 [Phoxinus phoxinus]